MHRIDQIIENIERDLEGKYKKYKEENKFDWYTLFCSWRDARKPDYKREEVNRVT